MTPTDRAADYFNCPQCGEETDTLTEGHCPDCCEANTTTLLNHNWQFDRWERMTDQQRDEEIRRAY